MTLKLYLAGIIFATVLSFVAFFGVVFFFSPEGADVFLFSLLFSSLFVALAGLFGLAGFFARKKIYRNYPAFRFLAISFRQGALFSLLLCGSLALRAFDFFWWWSGVFLLALVIAIEFISWRKED